MVMTMKESGFKFNIDSCISASIFSTDMTEATKLKKCFAFVLLIQHESSGVSDPVNEK